MTAVELFDESKAGAYLGVAVHVPSQAVTHARKEIKGLFLPRQRSIHFKDEDESRKRKIVDAFAELASLGVTGTVYDAGRNGSQFERRRRCLSMWVIDASGRGAGRLLLDRDAGLVKSDRQILIELMRAAGTEERISYDHLNRHEELLLALPDTIAWCWAKGGDWRRRVGPIVGQVRAV